MFSQLIVNGLVAGSSFALIAIGHSMIFGLMKIANFAHGEFYMLGAFITYMFLMSFNGFGLGYFGAAVASVLFCFVFGIIMDRLIFRRIRNEDMIVSTLVTIALSIIIMNLARIIWGAAPKNIPVPFTGGIELGSLTVTYSRIFILVITIAVILALHFFIQKTTIGKAFRATFQNREAAMLSGIEIEGIYSLNMALGSALAGLSGAMLGLIFILEPTMGIKAITVAWIVVVTGGPGSMVGAILIGFLLGMAESFGGYYISSQYKDAIGFLILVLVLIIKPQGLFSKAASRMGG